MNQTLRLTTPRMTGPAVKRLQEAGDILGFDTGKNDGIFGKNTERAVKLIQEKFGLAVDGVCGPATWAAIEDNWPDVTEDKASEREGIVDIRGTHAPPKLYGRKRRWTDINGVTLHQTGCTLSDKPARWKNLNAHIGITRGGKVILVNDPTDMIWHAQGLSKATIGLEICGNYQGIDGNDRTRWKEGGGPDHLTPAMTDALTRAFNWIAEEFEKHNQKWLYVNAHRQSSPTRTADPGSEIWQKIALPWLEKINGTDGGPDWFKGDGKPIPKEWNPSYTSAYWQS